jgi:hypothetical protein
MNFLKTLKERFLEQEDDIKASLQLGFRKNLSLAIQDAIESVDFQYRWLTISEGFTSLLYVLLRIVLFPIQLFIIIVITVLAYPYFKKLIK